MLVLPKYLVFVLLIIIFNCILIAIFKWNYHQKIVYEIKNAKCDVDACIRVCCENNWQCLFNDTFEDIYEMEEAQNLSRNFHVLKEDLECSEPEYLPFYNNDSFVFLEVKFLSITSKVLK